MPDQQSVAEAKVAQEVANTALLIPCVRIHTLSPLDAVVLRANLDSITRSILLIPGSIKPQAS